jgi:hypothetical protein
MNPIHSLKRCFLRILVVAGIAQSLFAQAATTSDIQGVWILDIPETERAIYAAPPYDLARGFAMASSSARILIFQVKGDTVTSGTYGNWNTASVKLTSQQDGGFRFIPNVKEGGITESVVIYPHGGSNLRIFFPGNPPMRHMIWKRIQLDPSRTTPADVGQAGIDEWIAALQRIQKTLDSPQPIGPPDAAR